MHRFGDAGPLAPSRGIGTWSPTVCASECDPECACGCCLLRRLKEGSAVSLHTSWGSPPRSKWEVQRARPVSGLCSLSHSVKVLKRFVDWAGGSQSVRSPRRRPGSPWLSSAMRPMRSAPATARRIQAGSSNRRSYSISDLFAFSRERRLFLSPRVVSPFHTRARLHVPHPSPALPRVLWGKAIGRDDSPSTEQPRPCDSSSSPALSGLRGSGVDRFWAGSPALRSAPSPREASAFPQLAHRPPLVPSPTPGRRRLRVHLAATPDQLQPLDPAFKGSRPSSSQPTRCRSKASRAPRKGNPLLSPSHGCACTFTSAKVWVPASDTSEQVSPLSLR